MKLKDEILKDIDNVFLNIDDFADEHMINNVPIMCIFDDEELTERQGSNELAVSDSSVVLFAKSEDLPPKQPANTKIKIDGKTYIVDDWKENMGMSELALHHGESRGG